MNKKTIQKDQENIQHISRSRLNYDIKNLTTIFDKFYSSIKNEKIVKKNKINAFITPLKLGRYKISPLNYYNKDDFSDITQLDYNKSCELGALFFIVQNNENEPLGTSRNDKSFLLVFYVKFKGEKEKKENIEIFDDDSPNLNFIIITNEELISLKESLKKLNLSKLNKYKILKNQRLPDSETEKPGENTVEILQDEDDINESFDFNQIITNNNRFNNMSLNLNEIKNEYNKRLKFFLKEEMNFGKKKKDEKIEDYINHAKGLSVFDRAGQEYTVLGTEEHEKGVNVILLMPGIGIEDQTEIESYNKINENRNIFIFESENEITKVSNDDRFKEINSYSENINNNNDIVVISFEEFIKRFSINNKDE